MLRRVQAESEPRHTTLLSTEQYSERDTARPWVNKKGDKVGDLDRKERTLFFHLLLGDISLDELLQNPTVVDVSTAAGTQRPVSLSVTQNIPSLMITVTNCYHM